MPSMDSVSENPLSTLAFAMGNACPCCTPKQAICCCPDRTLPSILNASIINQCPSIFDPDCCCNPPSPANFILTQQTPPPSTFGMWSGVYSNGTPTPDDPTGIATESFYMELALLCDLVLITPFGNPAEFIAFCGSLNNTMCCAWRIRVVVACGGRGFNARSPCLFYAFDTFFSRPDQSVIATDPYYSFDQVVCDPFLLSADVSSALGIGPAVVITE